ncbi:MAG: sulfotransferase, partial [Pseudomonadota bacterium]|nr:sulfotransferase [Pseudomonadota bacterium]
GRMSAAAAVMRPCFERGQHGANLAINAIELLDDCDRKRDASAIAEAALVAQPTDPRLHAYAGMLALQLGEFEYARQHNLFALEHSPQACEWHVPLGLSSAQRYADAAHPDFARFDDCLRRSDLSPKARSTLLFAMGKAYDDIGEYAQAADYFREANAVAHALTKWSRKSWRRTVQSQLATKPIEQWVDPSPDFVPIFIVGMPRSGTTLVAEWLSRYHAVCNRGESPWLAKLANEPELSGAPGLAALQRAAKTYAAQLRQDDAEGARWFIAKQPLNFRYIGLALARFSNARIIDCQRNPRDTALALWMQSFTEDVQGYAYAFADIAAVMDDCERLMAHWRKARAGSIRTLRYELLVAEPAATLAELAAWLELLPTDASTTAAESSTSINTASLWQARQPVYTRSVQRWKNYAPYVVELLEFSAD